MQFINSNRSARLVIDYFWFLSSKTISTSLEQKKQLILQNQLIQTRTFHISDRVIKLKLNSEEEKSGKKKKLAF